MTSSKTRTSFYRRLYVARLIDCGTDTVPLIIQATGMPRRTAQDTIASLADLDIRCEFQGAKKNGHYRITDWGPISRTWVTDHARHLADVLGYPPP